MLCYICHRNFQLLTLLIEHFKNEHGLTTNSVFRCYENDCNRSFQNLSSFKKHMKIKHVEIDKTDNNVLSLQVAKSCYSNSDNPSATNSTCVAHQETNVVNIMSRDEQVAEEPITFNLKELKKKHRKISC